MMLVSFVSHCTFVYEGKIHIIDREATVFEIVLFFACFHLIDTHIPVDNRRYIVLSSYVLFVSWKKSDIMRKCSVDFSHSSESRLIRM